MPPRGQTKDKSAERFAEWSAMRDSGLTFQEIADAVGVTRQAVESRLCSRLPRQTRGTKSSRNKQAIARLIWQGLTDAAIGKQLGIHEATVYNFRRRHDFPSERGIVALLDAREGID